MDIHKCMCMYLSCILVDKPRHAGLTSTLNHLVIDITGFEKQIKMYFRVSLLALLR